MNDGKNSDRKLNQWNNILEKSDCASKKKPQIKPPKNQNRVWQGCHANILREGNRVQVKMGKKILSFKTL